MITNLHAGFERCLASPRYTGRRNFKSTRACSGRPIDTHIFVSRSGIMREAFANLGPYAAEQPICRVPAARAHGGVALEFALIAAVHAGLAACHLASASRHYLSEWTTHVGVWSARLSAAHLIPIARMRPRGSDQTLPAFPLASRRCCGMVCFEF